MPDVGREFLTPEELVRSVVKIWSRKKEVIERFGQAEGVWNSFPIIESGLLMEGASRQWLVTFCEAKKIGNGSSMPYRCYVSGSPIKAIPDQKSKKSIFQLFKRAKEDKSPTDNFSITEDHVSVLLGKGTLLSNALVVIDSQNNLRILENRFANSHLRNFYQKKNFYSKEISLVAETKSEEELYNSDLINYLSALLLSVLTQ